MVFVDISVGSLPAATDSRYELRLHFYRQAQGVTMLYVFVAQPLSVADFSFKL
jgi:hypothetical protein